MFSLTPEEKKELLRLLKLAQDCGQLFVDVGAFVRPEKLAEDSEGDIVIYLGEFE